MLHAFSANLDQGSSHCRVTWGDAIVFWLYNDHTEVRAKSVPRQIIGRLNYGLQGNIYDYNWGNLKKFCHIWEENLCLMKTDSFFRSTQAIIYSET